MSNYFTRLGIDLGILVILLMALVLILIVIVLNQSLLLHRMIRRYHMFMKGSDGMTLEKLIAKNMNEIERLATMSEDHEERICMLQEHAELVFSKYGMVKYDAFDDVGGKLSFALTLLDEDNNCLLYTSPSPRD